MRIIAAPTFEHLEPALGIGIAEPRVSWRIEAEPGFRQAAYVLRVRRGDAVVEHRVDSRESVLVPWPGAPLASREAVEVSVRVLGEDGTASDWSAPGTVEAGLLDPLDWDTGGIRPAWREDPDDERRRPPLLRRGFELPADAIAARLYVSAHGVYEIEINGQRVGRDELNPGWTVYPERLRYHAYDVTGLLREGPNAIGAWLGDGWWRGRIGFNGGTANVYGDDVALIARLEVQLADGGTAVVTTDERWRAHPSPIVSSSLYLGETFDERETLPGWSGPGFDDGAWSPVVTAEFANGTLVAASSPPVRCTEELEPVEATRLADGCILLDFGQNHSGRLRLRADAGVGAELVIRHAEVLQQGELYVRTLRGAISVDRYLGSTGAIDWEPRFTIHGFRYAEISGYDGPLEELRVVSRVLHSDLRRTGWLESSDPELDRLHENVVWSMRSNFVDLPTDCPQRDERLGWTGDIQVFAPTASYLFDSAGFLGGWLEDLAIEQRRTGTVPWFVPVIPAGPHWTPARPGAVWGDAAALTPQVLWERYGDRRIVERQYGSARAWVDQIAAIAGPSRLWDTGMQLGDWLDPTAPPEDPAAAVTDRYLVATAYLHRSARAVADLAAVLGRDDESRRYAALAEEVRRAFRARWTDGAGALLEPTQTGLALAIVFELLDARERAAAGERLAELVRERGNRIGAGFAGVNLVSDALSGSGALETAYDLLLEPATPSWISMVRKGATTIWERWDSLLDDGTVNPGEMTSFNHYALGAVADWMHRVIGGIAPLAPGYREALIAPRPGGGLTSASGRLDTGYGAIETSWTLVDGRFALRVRVPVGVTATVSLPSGREQVVEHGEHRFEEAA